jgi:hypothetical protein
MSVQAPANVQDVLDKIGNITKAKSALADLGLLAEVGDTLDRANATLHQQVGGRIKFAPGAKVRLIELSDGSHIAYDEVDGQPSFDVPEIVKATDVALADAPAGGDTGTPVDAGTPVAAPA